MKKPLFAIMNQVVFALTCLSMLDILIALLTMIYVFWYGFFVLSVLAVIISVIADFLEKRFYRMDKPKRKSITRLQKAMELRPDLSEYFILNTFCPADIYPRIVNKGIRASSCAFGYSSEKCRMCWNEPYEE